MKHMRGHERLDAAREHEIGGVLSARGFLQPCRPMSQPYFGRKHHASVSQVW